MSYLNKNIIDRIDEKLYELEKLRPISSALVRKLQEQFALEMTYNSNAIEGNSLTLNETFLGLTLKGIPLKDHLDVKENIYLKTLIPSKSKKYFTLTELEKLTPYTAKYLNFLARHGKIEAHKEGRNWVISLDAIKRYQSGRQRKRG